MFLHIYIWIQFYKKNMERGVNTIPNQRWESKENALYLSSYAKKIYDKSKHYTYGMPESLLRSSIGAQYLLYVGTVTQR